MTDEKLIDTNILVYAFDQTEKSKMEKAKKIVEGITRGEAKGAVSNQILGELYTVLTKKIQNPLGAETAQLIVNGLIDSANWKKINYTSSTAGKAIESSITEKKPFWDCLIAETMVENQIQTIITENTQHFSQNRIKTINPFK